MLPSLPLFERSNRKNCRADLEAYDLVGVPLTRHESYY